jgi:hypothetical protein
MTARDRPSSIPGWKEFPDGAHGARHEGRSVHSFVRADRKSELKRLIELRTSV